MSLRPSPEVLCQVSEKANCPIVHPVFSCHVLQLQLCRSCHDRQVVGSYLGKVKTRAVNVMKLEEGEWWGKHEGNHGAIVLIHKGRGTWKVFNEY